MLPKEKFVPKPSKYDQFTCVGELGEYTLRTEPVCTRCKQERSMHSMEPPYDTDDCPGFSYIND